MWDNLKENKCLRTLSTLAKAQRKVRIISRTGFSFTSTFFCFIQKVVWHSKISRLGFKIEFRWTAPYAIPTSPTNSWSHQSIVTSGKNAGWQRTILVLEHMVLPKMTISCAQRYHRLFRWNKIDFSFFSSFLNCSTHAITISEVHLNYSELIWFIFVKHQVSGTELASS